MLRTVIGHTEHRLQAPQWAARPGSPCPDLRALRAARLPPGELPAPHPPPRPDPRRPQRFPPAPGPAADVLRAPVLVTLSPPRITPVLPCPSEQPGCSPPPSHTTISQCLCTSPAPAVSWGWSACPSAAIPASARWESLKFPPGSPEKQCISRTGGPSSPTGHTGPVGVQRRSPGSSESVSVNNMCSLGSGNIFQFPPGTRGGCESLKLWTPVPPCPPPRTPSLLLPSSSLFQSLHLKAGVSGFKGKAFCAHAASGMSRRWAWGPGGRGAAATFESLCGSTGRPGGAE